MTNSLLLELDDCVESIKRTSQRVTDLIKEDISTLESLKSEVSEYEKLLTDIKIAHDNAKQQLSVDLTDYSKQIETLKAEVQRAEYEISGYVAKKGALKLENVRLSELNRKFKEYELKSMKILQAKEASLLERQDEIEQKEGLRPKSRTLLPPTDE